MRLICLAVIALFLTVAILPIQAQVNKGLIVYFDFNKADGKTIVNGAGATHGTMNDKAKLTAKGKYGGALDSQDKDSLVTVESFPALEAYQDNSYLLKAISIHLVSNNAKCSFSSLKSLFFIAITSSRNNPN